MSDEEELANDDEEEDERREPYSTNLIKCLSTLAMKIVLLETLLKAEEKFLIHLYSFCFFLYT